MQSSRFERVEVADVVGCDAETAAGLLVDITVLRRVLDGRETAVMARLAALAEDDPSVPPAPSSGSLAHAASHANRTVERRRQDIGCMIISDATATSTGKLRHRPGRLPHTGSSRRPARTHGARSRSRRAALRLEHVRPGLQVDDDIVALVVIEPAVTARQRAQHGGVRQTLEVDELARREPEALHRGREIIHALAGERAAVFEVLAPLARDLAMDLGLGQRRDGLCQVTAVAHPRMAPLVGRP